MDPRTPRLSYGPVVGVGAWGSGPCGELEIAKRRRSGGLKDIIVSKLLRLKGM